jgi:hypothetical protein
MNKMAMVSEGDLATVDMNVVRHEDARRGMGLGHWLKVVRDTVRMGDGKVRVERIRGVDADVVADGGGAIMGPVTVPLGALRKANMSSKSAADSEVVFHAFSRGGRWELVGYADGKYEDLRHGKVTGSGGAFSRMGLAHKLAAMVQDSKIMDGINYIIDVDRRGVKQLLSKIDPSKVAPAEFYRMGKTVNKIAVAKELVAIARELQAIEFPTQDAYDKYMKDHPDADKSNHRVVETKKEQGMDTSHREHILKNVGKPTSGIKGKNHFYKNHEDIKKVMDALESKGFKKTHSQDTSTSRMKQTLHSYKHPDSRMVTVVDNGEHGGVVMYNRNKSVTQKKAPHTQQPYGTNDDEDDD